jgi:hypothetical protein
MVKIGTNLNLVSLTTGLIIILTSASASVLYSDFSVNAQQIINETSGQNASNATQTPGGDFDRSIIGTVVNITNNTNPTGAAVQQMIQATSTANTTSTANITTTN